MSGLSSTWNGLIAGWTLRANSSNTRCWYSISVTNRAAWNSRSPFQPSGVPAASFHCARAAMPAPEVSLLQRVLDVVDQPVVLGVEDLVDRGQRDVLVDATVTGA